MKGLIIKEPWISHILNGQKVWEIRSKNAKIRGEIALIRSGSGQVIGTVKLVDSIKLELDTFDSNKNKHLISDTKTLPYKDTYAWVLENPSFYKEPIPYQHPKGAVIWVNLNNL